MLGDGPAEVAGADQDRPPVGAEPQYLADLFIERLDVVAVPLLAEAAEAV